VRVGLKSGIIKAKANKAEAWGEPGSRMLSEAAWAAVAGSLQLSRRHMEVVKGVFDSDKETAIADYLGISQHTVHTHLDRIYEKLGVGSRQELVQAILGEFLRLTADPGSEMPPICRCVGREGCALSGCGPVAGLE
jgi:DNA-binding CsgD family transcriptional regulator